MTLKKKEREREGEYNIHIIPKV